MGLFKKKKTIVATDIDFEDLRFFRVQDTSGIYDYAELVMHRLPIVLNFSDCLITEANEVLLFLTGVLYACDGDIVKIQDKIYLMAQKSDLKGPTLTKFVHEYQKK
ncbi:MAG: cell division protein SepF [Candidatus Izemoplasmatales bacterium]|nr:cell division protein SepF [Candidatus Izemoplasmatales bacterium]